MTKKVKKVVAEEKEEPTREITRRTERVRESKEDVKKKEGSKENRRFPLTSTE